MTSFSEVTEDTRDLKNIKRRSYMIVQKGDTSPWLPFKKKGANMKSKQQESENLNMKIIELYTISNKKEKLSMWVAMLQGETEDPIYWDCKIKVPRYKPISLKTVVCGIDDVLRRKFFVETSNYQEAIAYIMKNGVKETFIMEE